MTTDAPMGQTWIDLLYHNTAIFNEIAGNAVEEMITPKFYEDFRKQALRVLEEAQEAITAAETKDKVECLDAAIDILVTSFGLVRQLSAVKANVAQAAVDISYNNLDKIFDDKYEASVVLDDMNEMEPNSPTTYFLNTHISKGSVVGGEQCWYSIKRRADGKIMKSPTHPKVDLRSYVP